MDSQTYQRKNVVVNIEQKNSLIEQYCIKDEINIGKRDYMEDGSFFSIDYWNSHKIMIFGVLDGHCGEKVMKYVESNFCKVFIEVFEEKAHDLRYAIEESFKKIDQDIMKKQELDSVKQGSCACIGFYHEFQGEILIYIANIGDTRATQYCIANNFSKQISYDHKATDTHEIARVKQAGGVVYYHRVNGELAVTRAFGDHSLRSSGVIEIPHIEQLVVDDNLQYLVIASDGLWDVIEDEDILKILKKQKNFDSSAEVLVNAALRQGSGDNITVMVLKFKALQSLSGMVEESQAALLNQNTQQIHSEHSYQQQYLQAEQN